MSSLTQSTSNASEPPPPRADAAARDAERPDPSKIFSRKVARESLPARTRQLAGVIARLYDEQLRSVGLTADQFEILALVGSRGRATTREIAGHLHLEPSTLAATIRSMTESRWLCSQEDPATGMSEIAWTRQGRRLFDQAIPAWKRAQHAAADLLGSDGTHVLTSGDVHTPIW